MFRNIRFSAASFSIAVAFFGLFGFIFLITQYFQIVHGYSPLSAGLRTLPSPSASVRPRRPPRFSPAVWAPRSWSRLA